jgi:SAM-dependent methyltransferase
MMHNVVFNTTGLDVDARNRVLTKNAMGFMFLGQSLFKDALHAFIKPNFYMADIGCAYGVDTLYALHAGAHVTAIDLDPAHLAVLEGQVCEEERTRLTVKCENFPEQTEITLQPNSFDAILLSRVLIFLHPQQLERALKQVYAALKPGGSVFVVNATPYSDRWEKIRILWEEQQRETPEQPFFVENIGGVLPALKPYFPDNVLLFDEKSMTNLLESNGFSITSCDYMTENGTVDIFAIAQKPPREKAV